MPPDVTVPLRHLLDMDITFEAVPRFATPRGQRMLLAARSGRFEGPGLSVTGRAVLGEHTARFLAGERVTADEAYLRTHPLFETASPAHAHLNGLATVAWCDIALTGIRYRVYAVS
jgi:hypothetical protein